MTDVVDKATRSRMMSGIRAKDTRPEILVRKGLFSRGFRYRVHVKSMAGKPDLVLPRYKAAIFVNGCFWHGHDCHLFKMPSTNRKFWKQKFETNRRNDALAAGALIDGGWRVLVVWECSLKGKNRLPDALLLDRIEAWIRSGVSTDEIRGNDPQIVRTGT